MTIVCVYIEGYLEISPLYMCTIASYIITSAYHMYIYIHINNNDIHTYIYIFPDGSNYFLRRFLKPQIIQRFRKYGWIYSL